MRSQVCGPNQLEPCLRILSIYGLYVDNIDIYAGFNNNRDHEKYDLYCGREREHEELSTVVSYMVR